MSGPALAGRTAVGRAGSRVDGSEAGPGPCHHGKVTAAHRLLERFTRAGISGTFHPGAFIASPAEFFPGIATTGK